MAFYTHQCVVGVSCAMIVWLGNCAFGKGAEVVDLAIVQEMVDT